MLAHEENEDRYKKVLTKIAQNFTELFIYLFTEISDLHKSTQRQFFKPILSRYSGLLSSVQAFTFTEYSLSEFLLP